MSVGTVLTLGYGSFGNKSFIPTLGYGPYDIPADSGGGVGGGGGGVARWPGRTEFGWEKWRRKEDAKLAKKKAKAEKRVDKIEADIRSVSARLELAREITTIQSLVAELEKLEKQLSKAREVIDRIEMEEVLVIWAITR